MSVAWLPLHPGSIVEELAHIGHFPNPIEAGHKDIAAHSTHGLVVLCRALGDMVSNAG